MSVEKNKEVLLDLASLDDVVVVQEEGYDLDILHPQTGVHLGIVVRIAGPDSHRARKAQMAATNDSLRSMRVKRATAEDSNERGLRHLAALVISWSTQDAENKKKWHPFILLEGQELPPSVENAVRVFNRYPWLASQVDAATADRTLFMRA